MAYPVVVTEPTGEGMETIVESISNIDTDGIITALEGIRDAISGSTGGVEIVVENAIATGYTVSAVIPDGVTSIGDFAFEDAPLTQINIPDSVTSIGENAFGGAVLLAQIIIPDSVTSIGDYAFYNCSSLTQINIPNGVTSIGDFAFSSTGLMQVNIPDGVTSIGDNAFNFCLELTQIYIPDNVTSIGVDAFDGINANAVIDCGFAEGAVTGAPWGAPNTVTINYGVTPNN